jgi:hypothetical protein
MKSTQLAVAAASLAAAITAVTVVRLACVQILQQSSC